MKKLLIIFSVLLLMAGCKQQTQTMTNVNLSQSQQWNIESPKANDVLANTFTIIGHGNPNGSLSVEVLDDNEKKLLFADFKQISLDASGNFSQTFTLAEQASAPTGKVNIWYFGGRADMPAVVKTIPIKFAGNN